MFKTNDRVRLVNGPWNREHGTVRYQPKANSVNVKWDVVGCLQPYNGGNYLPEELELAPQVHPSCCKCNEHRIGCALCTVSSDDAKAEPDGVGFSPLLAERNELREQVRFLTKALAEKNKNLDELYYEVAAAQQAIAKINFPKEWTK